MVSSTGGAAVCTGDAFAVGLARRGIEEMALDLLSLTSQSSMN